MAWRCVRCTKNIFAPRADSFGYALKWTYNRNTRDLSADIKNLHDVKENAVLTHVICKAAPVDGFADRMRKALRIPKTTIHPILFE